MRAGSFGSNQTIGVSVRGHAQWCVGSGPWFFADAWWFRLMSARHEVCAWRFGGIGGGLAWPLVSHGDGLAWRWAHMAISVAWSTVGLRVQCSNGSVQWRFSRRSGVLMLDDA